MEKKKMKIWKKILIVLGIILTLFLIHTLRNITIIKNLSSKADAYKDITNYYIKATSSQGNFTETFYKDGRYVFKLENVSETGVRKLTNHFNGEKINTYIETETELESAKVAILDSNGLPSVNGINTGLYINDAKELILMSMMASIKSVEMDGIKCYKIGNFYSANILCMGDYNFELYIEKDTGLMIKNQNGTVTDENGIKISIVTEYEYKFDVVTDEDLVEPDISGYKIQE